MKELILKKCLKCGAVVEVLKDCHCKNCGIKCCGKEMMSLIPNSVDASFEKHVPTFTRDGDDIFVTVNHVMQEDHYIEWIMYVTPETETKIILKPGDEAVASFKYEEGCKIYAYCNQHGLWVKEIK